MLFGDLPSPRSPGSMYSCSPGHDYQITSPSSPQSAFILPSLCSSSQHHFSMPSPISPHPPPYSSSNNNNFFQFPSAGSSNVYTSSTSHDFGSNTTEFTDHNPVKEEPWSLTSQDWGSAPPDYHHYTHDLPTAVAPSQYEASIGCSVSPMMMSPAVSNLNTPRVSLSSVHSEFSNKIRSSHSSLETSPHTSPIGFMEHVGSGLGGCFGHSIPHQEMTSMDTTGSQHHDDTGYITPPRSGYSSPHQDTRYSNHQPPSVSAYDPPSLQSFHVTSTSALIYQHQHHTYDSIQGVDPLAMPFTPDHDSTPFSEKDKNPDTPDSSIKEEPSEECGEEGVTVCR